MKITLKNIHFSERMSTDSNCFDAMVCIDGKPSFVAMDDGHGGCTDFLPRSPKTRDQDRKAIADAEAWARTLPPITEIAGMGKLDVPMENSLELVIGDLVEQWKEDKEFARKCKTHVLYRLPGQSKMQYYQIKGLFTPEVERDILKKHPDAIIINLRYPRPTKEEIAKFEEAELRKVCKRHVVAICPAIKPGKVTFKAAYSPAVAAALKEKYPGIVILNERYL